MSRSYWLIEKQEQVIECAEGMSVLVSTYPHSPGCRLALSTIIESRPFRMVVDCDEKQRDLIIAAMRGSVDSREGDAR